LPNKLDKSKNKRIGYDMKDKTENTRREMVNATNSNPKSREGLEANYGQVWDTKQLQEEFVVKGFLAPFVTVERRSDGRKGTLMFQHNPRFYFSLNWSIW